MDEFNVRFGGLACMAKNGLLLVIRRLIFVQQITEPFPRGLTKIMHT